MTPGEILLAAALASAIAGIVTWRWRDVAARVHVALVVAALVLLTADFLAGTLYHQYAFDHTRVDYPFFYRLAGLWGGEEGTVLLWNAVVAIALLFVREPLPRRLLLAFSGALTLFGLLFGAFHRTDAAALASAPFGRGLADVLLTPLMVIHPPLQFVAYGLISVPAAYALASLWAPAASGEWAGRAYPWARRAWLFATLGLGLGALWAYYVLSFGGYWAWDPVETANLLPWLALTAFLHAGKQRMRSQGHETAAPLLAYGAFLLTLFATFSTRSGLWVSVHAFTDPTDRFEPDAPARLLAILDAHLPTHAFFALLSAALFGGVGVWCLRRLRTGYGTVHGVVALALAGAALLAPRETWGALFALADLAPSFGLGLGLLLVAILGAPFVVAFATADEAHAKLELSNRTLLAAAAALLSIALGVTFLLDLQVVNGPEREAFDQRAPFIVVPIVVTMTLMLALAPLGKRGAVALAGGALALGLAGAVAFPQARVLALAAPLGAAATFASILKLAHVQGTSTPARLRIAGALLMLASLLAMVMWSNPPTYAGGVAIPDGASLALGLAGIALGALGFVGSVAAFRGRSFGLAVAGACGAALAAGYLVGALVALPALALILRERAAFARGWPEPARVREAGIYLVHLAVAIGLLGYAASTYAQEREVFTGVGLESELGVADYAITMGTPRAIEDAGGLARLEVPLEMTKEGVPAGAESLTFAWKPTSALYGGDLDVRRSLVQDVYVRPLAFHTPDGWVGADSAIGSQVSASGVDAVTFSVSVLPLMSLVWAGTWMMVIGMTTILIASRR